LPPDGTLSGLPWGNEAWFARFVGEHEVVSTPTPTPDEYFDSRWTNDDPWDQTDRWSDLRKFDLTVAILPEPRYGRAFEPGCGTGLLTERLAPRCDALVAADRHPHAVSVAGRRCAELANVEFGVARLPGEWPSGTFDLIVLSEVLYYLGDDDLDDAVARTAASLVPGGDLVAAHFRFPLIEHARRGDEIHERLGAQSAWRRVARYIEDRFVLEAFRRQ
jgi:SAM-dependent methyltransferase